MSSRREFGRLYRGIVALEGVVNQTRAAYGLKDFLDEDRDESNTLDRVASKLIEARQEILHRLEMKQALARVRRGPR